MYADNTEFASAPTESAAKVPLPFSLEGKKGLITGIANDRSIAWGAAKVCRSLGAELAVTYLNEKAKPHVEPLAAAVGAELLMPLDLRHEGELEAVFEAIATRWGKLDFLVHSIAFASEIKSRVIDVTKAGFLEAMELSCWSFIRMAHLAEPLMTGGGCLVTYSYLGADMVVPNYNVMGPVKAALESVSRYLAAELGPKGIRVHAVSPGPLRTRAASGIAHFDDLLAQAEARAPLHQLVDIEDVGNSTAFLVSDAGKHLTGSLHYVDSGYHIVG
ncbi:enoyl-ACP reductase FabI [Benzoatithermus flavus]|uniref:Enoyl-[acyl-carrier-protein] reductase [NADH] n=1 Tax=Benzoatithermus flavus TaxID=3108223 RepID=A0ABU8XPN6_9PROT